jgi:hypothetical protein
VASSNYSFYLSGMESVNGGPNFYALAGSVTIDANGNVVTGEQDYNDGTGYTFPGDTISGGTLTWVDAATGQGTLTLITGNTSLGASGVETLGVQFVNTNHALIVQFDGSATSSGSMDLQTLSSTLNDGNYAFTLSGVDATYYPVVFGGVFQISASGTALQGVFDANDAGVVKTEQPFSATISTADGFGRGTITVANGNIATTVIYYIIGPEAIRIIDMDATDSGVGSAFGQGTGTFSSTSLVSSVFGVESNSFAPSYAAAGMFTTDGAGNISTGVADDNEEGTIYSDKSISGTYAIPASSTVCGSGYSGTAYNGYGCLTITSGNLGHVSALGIYMTDPTLNLLDPNNTASGLGGALMADLDTSTVVALVGTGVLIPQTDTATTDFTGNYAFGAQTYFPCTISGTVVVCEFDFVGQGSVTSLAFGSGTAGLVSDPYSFFSANATDTGVKFSGTAVADTSNPGRYTIPLAVTVGTDSPVDLSVVIYQASGGQLFWLDEDSSDLFLGSLQQQPESLTGLPAARRAAAKNKPKQ